MTKYGVFIGRFQPFHEGHKTVIDKIIEDGLELLVLISSLEGGEQDGKNPYSLNERLDMIRNEEWEKVNYAIVFDHPDDNVWANQIIAVMKIYDIEAIYYHNKPEDRTDGVHYIEKCFGDKYELRHVDMKVDISGTKIRAMMNNPYLQIKENNGYYYAERLGKDSVAFILYNAGFYGLIKEYKPPIKRSLITAFGGSLDKHEPRFTTENIVLDEVLEEAGYKVERNNICCVHKAFVSTQMNQFCELYLVTVSDEQFVGRTTTDPREQSAEVVWLTERDVLQTSDWKAPLIVMKSKYNGIP